MDCVSFISESPVSSLVSGTYGALNRYLSLLNAGIDVQMRECTQGHRSRERRGM